MNTNPLSSLRAVWLALTGAALILALAAGPAHPQDAEIRQAVVKVSTVVPGTARTAGVLGREREGTGVIIDSSGLVLTIGYIMMEAREVTITLSDGRVLPAATVAYDHESGFGLLRTLQPPDVEPVRIGNSDTVADGDVALVLSATSGGAGVGAAPVRIVSRRPFAGYWEYLLDDAIFSSPPVPMFGGAAMVDANGTLLGIGSLVVGDAAGPNRPTPGNMFVPINELKPVLGELLESGRRQSSRPWIGVITEEHKGHVLVLRPATDGPAQKSGVESGDLILAVNGDPVNGMEDFLRKLGNTGAPDGVVPLALVRPGRGLMQVEVQSQDRNDWLRLNPGN